MNYDILVKLLTETNDQDFLEALVESLEERINDHMSPEAYFGRLNVVKLEKALDLVKSMQVATDDEEA